MPEELVERKVEEGLTQEKPVTEKEKPVSNATGSFGGDKAANEKGQVTE